MARVGHWYISAGYHLYGSSVVGTSNGSHLWNRDCWTTLVRHRNDDFCPRLRDDAGHGPFGERAGDKIGPSYISRIWCCPGASILDNANFLNSANRAMG